MSSPENDHQERIFINYAHQDSEAAQRLYNDLSSKSDLKPWLDKEDLLPGQSWDLEIRKAIKIDVSLHYFPPLQ